MAVKAIDAQEYVVLNRSLSFYKIFLFILNNDNEKISLQRKVIINQNLLPIEIKKAKELLSKKVSVRNSILDGLCISINAAEDIQKCFLGQNLNLNMAIEKASCFCQQYQEVYEEYENACAECKITLGSKMKKNILGRYIFKKFDPVSDKIVKFFSKSRIDTMNEYINIWVCVNVYSLFLDYTKDENGDKFSNAVEIIEEIDNIFFLFNNGFVPSSKEGITNEWANECVFLITSVRENMERFISYGEEAIYCKTTKDMRIFCNTHQLDFNKWSRDFCMYVQGQAKINRALFIALGILLALGISLAGLLYIMKEYEQELRKEEIEFFEETDLDTILSLEKEIPEQILARKL